MASLNEAEVETIFCRYGMMSFFAADAIISRSLKDYGEWAQAEVEFLRDLIRPGDTVLDVGAFIGTHALAFAEKVNAGGRVYAFEPQPAFFALLKRNIAQNVLTNVTVLNAAVSDNVGQVNIIESGLRDFHNFGAASVLEVSDPTSESPPHHSIELMTIDQLALNRCDLIKIDAENMEIKVVMGACETLSSKHPILCAECNSLEYGWPVIELLRAKGYSTYALIARSYNPNNFRANPNNCLGQGCEVSLVLVPAERHHRIPTSHSVSASLIPIDSMDDLALTLLKKPQYKYEVMAKTKTAGVLGVDFWANEIEVRQSQETLADNAQDIERLQGRVRAQETALADNAQDIERLQGRVRVQEAALADNTQDIERLQGRVRVQEAALAQSAQEITNLSRERESLQDKIDVIYASHGWRALRLYYNLRDKFLPEGSLRRGIARFFLTPRSGREGMRLLRDARSIAASRLFDSDWYLQQNPDVAKSGVNPLAHYLRWGTCEGRHPNPFHGLVYSIDSLRIKRRRIHGSGWAFHKNQRISALKLIVRTSSGSQVFDARYGTRRADVEQVHSFPNATNCGFRVSGLLPSEEVSEFSLRIEFHEPTSHPIQIKLTPETEEGGSPDTSVTLGSLAELLPALPSGSTQAERKCTGASEDEDVREFLNIAEESILSDHKFTLIIDHNLGGGANRYRHTVVGDIRSRHRHALVLYFDPTRWEYVLDCLSAGSTLHVNVDSPTELLSFVERIGLEEIILNNVYSFEDPLAMATLLPALRKASRAKLTIAMHDFLPVCPSLFLLDETGNFCGVPDLSRCEECLPNNNGDFSSLIHHRDIRSWRDTWRQCLLEATSIICFSESSAKLVQRAYPELDRAKYSIQPHVVDYLPPRKPLIDLKDTLSIGVVGFIGTHKGSNVIRELADCIARRALPARITIIGTIDQKPAHPFVTVTGPYRPEDLPDLIEEHRLNVFLLPSIVPETFSYVTEELMILQVPLAVFDLGAPPERVANYARGLVLRRGSAENILDALIAFHTKLRGNAERAGEREEPERRTHA